MSDEPKYRDEEWLREQYVERERTTTDIADELGCGAKTVQRWLKKHGIETRKPGPQCPDERLKDADWLRGQYVERERTIYDIADGLGCGAKTVQRWLKKHGIETRKGGPQCPDERLKDADWLRGQYVERERTSYDIADELECSSTAVWSWLKEHGIETRKGALTGLTGPENPNWRGGEARYGPGWTPAKRREIRERDDHTCQNPACSVTQDGHLAQYDQKLHVHHLIKARDIDDAEERNAPENLITLCRDCHREWERLSEAGIRPQIDGVTAD